MKLELNNKGIIVIWIIGGILVNLYFVSENEILGMLSYNIVLGMLIYTIIKKDKLEKEIKGITHKKSDGNNEYKKNE